MSVKLAVFDCDGTMVDGQGSICAAMESAFAAANLPAPDRHLIRRIVGLSLPQAMHRLAPDAPAPTHDLLVDAYKDAFRAARAAGELSQPLFAGIAEVIAGLAADGWTLGVATGMSQRGLDHVLAAHGLTHHFATLQTADFHPSKPHPAMIEAALAETGADRAATVMIGDTAYDMLMARDAGVRGLGVNWGYHTPAELREAGAARIASSPAELAAHIRESVP